MKNWMKWLAAFAVVGALAGCARTAPIDNIQSTVSAGHTEAQVKNAILKAGAQRQWIMNDAGPGVIKARQQNRDHIVEVRITYSATGYSIKYDSSLNLLASGGKIHKNYNRWVRNLDKDIQINLASSATQ
ncbi:hypothetical protein OZ379_000692 [Salmonella enterica]|uniref:hypothetical protein n=1 Tax=Salmonella enterica TaxID=28901 RepID=UPI0003BDACEB|nr:hypothetical protein [Salmonella enterica]EBR3855378.1 hypothetical protein [Salmonella enterica subsp. enterica]ECH9402184.1 hypothetical protein [Salmonella enterica subsp. diarizonae]ECT9714895.1 hypothetical protein [Salmonella enterica subsp. diarizonae str. CFSAN000553]EDD5837506.1 hypothetical protein [Salmonella enterica subsp. enterica serovar Enteritidis]EGE4751167.1 hypothetical protein [Salmonella enterica subsp. diarizonae serovar 38:[k]:z35]ESJ22703.1 lipoprotein [Salmonella 